MATGLFVIFAVWPAGFAGEKLIYVAAFTYLVLMLAFSPWIPFINLRKMGDWSYGVYLYAFPVQQFLVSVFPDTFTGWTLTIAAGFVTAMFGAASWHFVEKRALRLRTHRPFQPTRTAE